jgi:hypothetical protein
MSPQDLVPERRGGGSITRDANSAYRRADLYHLYSPHDLDNRVQAPGGRGQMLGIDSQSASVEKRKRGQARSSE